MLFRSRSRRKPAVIKSNPAAASRSAFLFFILIPPGALPDNYYSRLHIDTAKLASLLDEINRINTDDKENDIIGRVYEYFLSKFALAEGKGKGEFYTPKCIVNLIAEMLEPYDGILYDPCCCLLYTS